jgi:hypothetical protein
VQKRSDSIVVGFYERDDLVYLARVRNGSRPSPRDAVFKKFWRLESPNCPVVNLPEIGKGRFGEGSTAEKITLRRRIDTPCQIGIGDQDEADINDASTGFTEMLHGPPNGKEVTQDIHTELIWKASSV